MTLRKDLTVGAGVSTQVCEYCEELVWARETSPEQFASNVTKDFAVGSAASGSRIEETTS